MNIKVKVSNENINSGRRWNGSECAVANAWHSCYPGLGKRCDLANQKPGDVFVGRDQVDVITQVSHCEVIKDFNPGDSGYVFSSMPFVERSPLTKPHDGLKKYTEDFDTFGAAGVSPAEFELELTELGEQIFSEYLISKATSDILNTEVAERELVAV